MTGHPSQCTSVTLALKPSSSQLAAPSASSPQAHCRAHCQLSNNNNVGSDVYGAPTVCGTGAVLLHGRSLWSLLPCCLHQSPGLDPLIFPASAQNSRAQGLTDPHLIFCLVFPSAWHGTYAHSCRVSECKCQGAG